jgi:hypothetical protein
MKSVIAACVLLAYACSGGRLCRADAPPFALTPLGDFGVSATGKSFSAPTGVNDSGEVIGQSNMYLNGVLQSVTDFVWSQGQLTNINLPSSIDQICGRKRRRRNRRLL